MSEVFISDDKQLLQVDVIHQFLSEKAYWCLGIPKATIEKAIHNSLCFGMYKTNDKKQIGFARVVSDKATFAWICDVFILEEQRGHGYSKMLMQHVMNILKPMNLRRISLGTKDAHALYKRFGFVPSEITENYLELRNHNAYQKTTP
ncbi:MAG: GNAT family N-acetyltransferase [Bdellovibrionaceae bacterium]|nr:GNAT family N-acetyltransferase [Bdellovibrio sp.]